MTTAIEIKEVYIGAGRAKRFHAYRDGELLRKKDGTGRWFKTKEAAEWAARFSVKTER